MPITFLLFSILCVTGLTSCSNSPAAAATVWLCRPGLAHDPCAASLGTTVVSGTGSKRVVDYQPASHPAIDCFYVYPLVSLQTTPNTTLRIGPQETAIAELEASPFSRVCRVFAPMYQQVTLSSVSSQQAQQVAYGTVLAARRDYLAHYNDGRGVVLIGHSEGADELDQLISGQIDNNASVRRLLVSAILTGANLTVGANGTGPFSEIGGCRSASQTGCVVAYNAFSQPPPSDVRFSAGLIPGPERHRAAGGLHEPGCTRRRNGNARACIPGPASHSGGSRQRDRGNTQLLPRRIGALDPIRRSVQRQLRKKQRSQRAHGDADPQRLHPHRGS